MDGKRKKKAKMAKVMGEFKGGKLRSGSSKGPKVTNPKQAVAIGLSEAGRAAKGTVSSGAKKATSAPVKKKPEPSGNAGTGPKKGYRQRIEAMDL